jgi:hypothetical protein
MKKKYIFGILQILVLLLITLYVESIASGKLLLANGILDDEFSNQVLGNPIKIVSSLVLLNILFYLLSHRSQETKELKNLYNNICQLVFDRFVKPNTTLENQKFRVSVFKAQKGLIFRRSNYFIPEYRTYLKNVGRFQTRQEKKYCKIKFLPDEGAVGKSYSIGEIVINKTSEYTSLSSSRYFEEQKETFNLERFKTKSLNDKSSAFVACPIKYFKSDELFGVIVVDSLEPDSLNESEFRTIESVVENYSVFFNSNNN